jgi:hypothetical protein
MGDLHYCGAAVEPEHCRVSWLYYYISDHGWEHASRAVAVIRTPLNQDPHVQITLNGYGASCSLEELPQAFRGVSFRHTQTSDSSSCPTLQQLIVALRKHAFLCGPEASRSSSSIRVAAVGEPDRT